MHNEELFFAMQLFFYFFGVHRRCSIFVCFEVGTIIGTGVSV